MQMHNRSVTLFRRFAPRHVPSYQDAHGQTHTHKRALCQDVPGYALTFLPSLHQSLLFCLSYQRALCLCEMEREWLSFSLANYLSLPRHYFLFSCCPVSLHLTQAKVRSPPATFWVPNAISGHACNFCLILSLGWALHGALVFKVVASQDEFLSPSAWAENMLAHGLNRIYD